MEKPARMGKYIRAWKATSMREASKIQFAGELTSLRCGKPEASTVMGMAQAIVYLF